MDKTEGGTLPAPRLLYHLQLGDERTECVAAPVLLPNRVAWIICYRHDGSPFDTNEPAYLFGEMAEAVAAEAEDLLHPADVEGYLPVYEFHDESLRALAIPRGIVETRSA